MNYQGWILVYICIWMSLWYLACKSDKEKQPSDYIKYLISAAVVTVVITVGLIITYAIGCMIAIIFRIYATMT